MRRPARAPQPLTVALTLLFVACGGGGDGQGTDDFGEPGNAFDRAEDVLEDEGIDLAAEGSAEVRFMGQVRTIPAAPRLGCFLVVDGGSDGAVDFNGTREDGLEIELEWAGDNRAGAFIEIIDVDGTRYRSAYDSGVEATIHDGTSATVAGTVIEEGDPDRQELPVTVEVTCGV